MRREAVETGLERQDKDFLIISKNPHKTHKQSERTDFQNRYKQIEKSNNQM
jgi:hypothetical protein